MATFKIKEVRSHTLDVEALYRYSQPAGLYDMKIEIEADKVKKITYCSFRTTFSVVIKRLDITDLKKSTARNLRED